VPQSKKTKHEPIIEDDLTEAEVMGAADEIFEEESFYDGIAEED
jgi:hypothetical protein